MDTTTMQAIVNGSKPNGGVQTLVQTQNGSFVPAGTGVMVKVDEIPGTGLIVPPLSSLQGGKRIFTMKVNNTVGAGTSVYLALTGSWNLLALAGANGNIFGLLPTDFMMPNIAANNGAVAIPAISPFTAAGYTIGDPNVRPGAILTANPYIQNIMTMNALLESFGVIASKIHLSTDSTTINISTKTFLKAYYDKKTTRVKIDDYALNPFIGEDVQTTAIVTIDKDEMPFSLGRDSIVLLGGVQFNETLTISITV